MKATTVQDSAGVDPAANKNDTKKIQIFINEVGYRVTEPAMTGTQLKVLAAIPAQNQLFEDGPGNHDDPQVLDDTPFMLKSGAKFYDVPVGNFG